MGNVVNEAGEFQAGGFGSEREVEVGSTKKPRNVKPKYSKSAVCKKCNTAFSFMQGVGKPRTLCDSCK